MFLPANAIFLLQLEGAGVIATVKKFKKCQVLNALKEI